MAFFLRNFLQILVIALTVLTLARVLLSWVERWFEATRLERRDADDPELRLYRAFVEVLERNSRALERKDDKALADDLTADYVRTDLFGRKQTRAQDSNDNRCHS